MGAAVVYRCRHVAKHEQCIASGRQYDKSRRALPSFSDFSCLSCLCVVLSVPTHLFCHNTRQYIPRPLYYHVDDDAFYISAGLFIVPYRQTRCGAYQTDNKTVSILEKHFHFSDLLCHWIQSPVMADYCLSECFLLKFSTILGDAWCHQHGNDDYVFRPSLRHGNDRVSVSVDGVLMMVFFRTNNDHFYQQNGVVFLLFDCVGKGRKTHGG